MSCARCSRAGMDAGRRVWLGCQRRYQGRPVTVVARATPRLIDRGDLLAALDRAAARKVTIISAPAGSWKTSLLRAWAERPGPRHRSPVLPLHPNQSAPPASRLALLPPLRPPTA